MTGHDRQQPRPQNLRPARNTSLVDSYLMQEGLRTVHSSVELLYGPQAPDLAENDVVVVCVVRDGRPYVDDFVRHHLSVGFRHIVFLDNGSVDGTVEAIRKHQNVTVLRSDLPFKDHKIAMKRYLVERFGQARWSLCVDVDEMFDWPYSDAVGLESLLRYLKENRYTAVVAQMLDMFPDEPLELGGNRQGTFDDGSLMERHRFYDISDISRYPYEDHSVCGTGNAVSNDGIEVFSGGIRETVFDAAVPLTKHPLVFLDGKVTPADGHVHRVSNARVADFTAVLFHYKFLDGFRDQAVRAVREGNYFNDSGAYKRYLAVLEQNPRLRLRRGSSRELKSVNDLVVDRFLVVSEQYLSLVAREEEKRTDRPVGYPPYRLPSTLLKANARNQARAGGVPELREHIAELEKEAVEQEREIKGLERTNQDLTRQLEALASQLGELRSSKKWWLISVLSNLRARARALTRGGR